jgi:tetratricopeptide (TPR) repeat protein
MEIDDNTIDNSPNSDYLTKEKNDEIETLLNEVRNLIEEEKHELVEKAYKELISKYPLEESIFFEFGFYLYEEKKFDDARVYLIKAVELSPNTNPEKYFTLAEISVPEEAKIYYEHGIGICCLEMQKEQKDEEIKKLKRMISQAYCSLAKLEEVKLNIDNMVMFLNKAMEADDLFLEPYQIFLTIYYNTFNEEECRNLVKKFVEKLEYIEENCDEELANYEIDFFIFFVRLMIEGALWEDSIYILEIALGNNIKHLEANYLLAFCNFQIKNYEESKKIVKNLIKFGIKKSEDEELILGFNELVEELKSLSN